MILLTVLTVGFFFDFLGVRWYDDFNFFLPDGKTTLPRGKVVAGASPRPTVTCKI